MVKELEKLITDQIDEVQILDGDEKNDRMEAICGLVRATTDYQTMIVGQVNNEHDMALRKEELKHARNCELAETIVKTVVGLAEVAIPAIIYSELFHMGLKFEKEGTVTSLFYRNLIGKMRPGK